MCHDRGFSLVETVLAIGLLTGALVVLAQLVAAGVHTTAAAKYRTFAILLAQQKLERLRSEAALEDVAFAVEHLDAEGLTTCGTIEPCEAAAFTIHWWISPVALAPGMVLIEVAATHAHANYGEVWLSAIRARSVR